MAVLRGHDAFRRTLAPKSVSDRFGYPMVTNIQHPTGNVNLSSETVIIRWDIWWIKMLNCYRIQCGKYIKNKCLNPMVKLVENKSIQYTSLVIVKISKSKSTPPCCFLQSLRLSLGSQAVPWLQSHIQFHLVTRAKTDQSSSAISVSIRIQFDKLWTVRLHPFPALGVVCQPWFDRFSVRFSTAFWASPSWTISKAAPLDSGSFAASSSTSNGTSFGNGKTGSASSFTGGSGGGGLAKCTFHLPSGPG